MEGKNLYKKSEMEMGFREKKKATSAIRKRQRRKSAKEKQN